MLSARNVEAQLLQNAGPKGLNEVSAGVLHAVRKADPSVTAIWLTDEGGSALMFSGKPIGPWPELWAEADVTVEGFKAVFHIAITTRSVWIDTFWVALVFSILGGIAHIAITTLPLTAMEAASRLLDANRDQLQQQKRELDAAVNNMPIGLVMFDQDKRLIVGNEPYRAMYGLPPDVLHARHAFA